MVSWFLLIERIWSRKIEKKYAIVKICRSWQSFFYIFSLRWRHNEGDGVSNHQPHDCLLKRFFRRRSKKTSKLRVTGLCAWNSPVTGEFPSQRTSNAENVSICWRHPEITLSLQPPIAAFGSTERKTTQMVKKPPRTIRGKSLSSRDAYMGQ